MLFALAFLAASSLSVLGQDCTPASVPIPSTQIANLPDPFTFINGTRMTSKSQWACRRQEISAQVQALELGTFPPRPANVSASFSGNSLTIRVTENGKSISFSVSISKPSGTGPFPAIIAYGGSSIPIPAGVATITFGNDAMAAQQGTGSRGTGLFYNIYGQQHPAGALTAWAWGVDRIMDGLELVPATNIDPTRVGVTGCSRNGKGALVAGAFVDRIALTLPQESGSGGAACWRLSDAQKKAGTDVQTAAQIVTENPWTGRPFDQFVNKIPVLPVDHHSLAAMVAPRGLYVIENTSMVWLGAMSTYGCMAGARPVWEALGIADTMGYSQVGGHNHCAFPSAQQSELTSFINRFLLKQNVTTNVFRTDSSNKNGFQAGTWITWTTPALT